MTSTRSNPRLGQSSLALSSLGAVGGPRGTAAGALRVIIEFLTQYDPKAVKQAEADLNELQANEEKLGNQEIQLAERISKAKIKLAQSEAVQKAKFRDADAKAALAESQALRQTGRPADTRQAQQLLTLAIKRQGLNEADEKVVRSITGQRTRLATLEKQQLAISQDRLAVDEQSAAVESELGRFQALKTNLPSKLGGLAIGAIGGLVGGALIGAGFTAVQAVIDQIGQSVTDLIDPAHNARDAVKDLGKEINSIADAGDLTRLEAAKKFLKDLGIAADDQSAKILAEAAAQDKLSDAIDAQIKLLEIKRHMEGISQDDVQKETTFLIEQAKANGDLKTKVGGLGREQQQVTDTAYYEAIAQHNLILMLEDQQKASDDAAAAQARLQTQMEATAALADFAAAHLSDLINTTAQTQFIGPLDTKIEALQNSTGESSKTKGIQKKIDALQNASSGGSGKDSQLADIREQRAIILLRERLRLLGTNIDLEKYSGKFLLEAINAKLKALDKEAAAQDRLNRLLDLQYKMSQTIKRQQGESISDFVERRAQEQRQQLSDQRDIERDAQRERLQELQDQTQDEVSLKELAEKEKTAAAKTGSSARLKELQKELEASKKADKAALDSKIKSLEKQRDAYKALADNAAYYASVETQAKIKAAAAAANTVEKIAQLSGQVQGLYAAKSFLESLLRTGVLSASQVKEINKALAGIGSTLNAIGNQEERIESRTFNKFGAPTKFAGGYFGPVRNSSTPFGGRVQFGEEGTEWMAVFTTKMVDKMKGGSGTGNIGPFNIYGTADPYRDRYKFKQAVKEAVGESLG